MPADPIDGFGRRLLQVSPTEGLAFEAAAGKDVRFQSMDDALGWVLSAAFAGRPLVEVSRDDDRWSVVLHLPAAERTHLSQWFDVAEQERHGAWYLPKQVSLKAGLVNLPALFAKHPRFATGLALDDRARVETATSPAAIYLWAVLQPLFEQLMRPILLRGPELGLKTREEQIAAWTAVDDLCRSLDLHVDTELGAMRFGSGWSRRSTSEQLSLKQAYLAAIGAQMSREVGRRWRQVAIQSLATKYYAKAAKRPPTQRQVLTAPLQRVIAGWFLGDWLGFLDYLGEQPAPDEQITTALPEPPLYVNVQERAPAAAAITGVPEAEVQRILASFLGQTTLVSPVERRVGVMRRYWQVFDELHARQRPGMESLWGLVEDGYSPLFNPSIPRTPWQYMRVLPPVLLAEIDDCWGGVCIPRYPDRIVSATHPHKGLADALGPAVEFWHGVGLTAWFVCQGPSSRTDLPGMRAYYERSITALAEAGCPIHETLFAELIEAEQRLGKPEPIVEQLSRTTTPGSPVVVTATMNRGTRRAGFEILQEILTRHRRWWTATYLEAYLHHQWEHPVRAFANEYNREVARTGKAPTRRRLAVLGSPVANLWFGGDLATVASAIGVKAFAPQTRVKLMPDDRFTFARRVFTELGGHSEPLEASWRFPEASQRNFEALRLAGDCLRYVQQEECTGVAPTAAEFHADRYQWSDGLEAGWAAYVQAIWAARTVAVAPPWSGQGPASTQPMPFSMPFGLPAEEHRPFWHKLGLGPPG